MLQSLPGVIAMSAPPQDGGSSPSLFVQLIPFALVFVVFYFMLFAPMRRKQKKHQEMLSAIKPGDRVVTSGGIHGTVAAVGDDVVQVKIADQVKIEVSKNAIAGLRGEP